MLVLSKRCFLPSASTIGLEAADLTPKHLNVSPNRAEPPPTALRARNRTFEVKNHLSDLTLRVRSGDRIELMLRNDGHMDHPMHLHGHALQVLSIAERPTAEVVRDTVGLPTNVSSRSPSTPKLRSPNGRSTVITSTAWRPG
jgi:FtsP/CotA-like multicopper oxidase with cupredoxin domain